MLKTRGDGVTVNIEIWKSFVGSVRKVSGLETQKMREEIIECACH
jgi:hypothetical protein